MHYLCSHCDTYYADISMYVYGKDNEQYNICVFCLNKCGGEKEFDDIQSLYTILWNDGNKKGDLTPPFCPLP